MIDGYTNQQLTADAAKKLQALSLEDKFLTTIEKIGQWEIATKGRWYCSFSGGKDSTVLSYIAGKYLASYREPPHPLHLLFCDTGLEYPEVRKFAMSFPDWLSKRFPTVSIDFQRRRPKKRFYDVIPDYGYPIISKEISQRIYEARKKPDGAQDKILRGISKTKKDSSFYHGGLNRRFCFWKMLPFSSVTCAANIQKKSRPITLNEKRNCIQWWRRWQMKAPCD